MTCAGRHLLLSALASAVVQTVAIGIDSSAMQFAGIVAASWLGCLAYDADYELALEHALERTP